MNVLYSNNPRGQSDVPRRPFKSGTHFLHSLTLASQLEITVVRSIFQALQPVLPSRNFKSTQRHLHSLTNYCTNSPSIALLVVRFLKLFNLKAGTRMLQLAPAPMNNHVMCPASHFGWPNKRFKSFASLSGTACRSPLT
jgi:hypothetical protein